MDIKQIEDELKFMKEILHMSDEELLSHFKFVDKENLCDISIRNSIVYGIVEAKIDILIEKIGDGGKNEN